MSAPSRLLAALASAALLSAGALALPAPAHAGIARASVVRPTAGQATVPPDCSASPGTAGSPANVGAPHSPQLLRQLAGPSGTSSGSRTGGTSGGSRTSAANGTSGTGELAAAGLGTAAGPPALDPAAASSAASPAAPPGAVRGVDVAAFQHPVSAQYPQGAPIAWSQVAGSGIRFAAIKASEGNYYVNPFYAADLTGARAAGLAVIGYAFANPRPTCGTAAAQAQYLVSHARGAGGKGPVPPLMLDIEYNPYQGGECYGLSAGAMVTWIRAFEAKIKALTRHLPIIYTTQGWWAACTGGSTAFTAGPVWPAAYTTAADPPLPAGWTDWALWQYTSAGAVPGIAATRTDLDALNLLSPGAQSATARQPVSVPAAQVSAGPDPGLTYKSAGLPSGLSLSGGGLISGRAAASVAGQRATITAAWGAVLGSVTITWNVTGPVTVTAPAARRTAAGSPADFAVPAPTVPSGQNAAFTASGLPAGTVVSAGGQVTGWPLGRGRYRVTLHAADPAGDAGIASFTWTVTAPAGGAAGRVPAGARGQCLTDPGGASAAGTRIGTAACGGAGQAWTAGRDGTLRISGRCLAAAGPHAATAALAACSARSAGQRWFPGPGGRLVSAAHGGCLTGPNAGRTAVLRVARCTRGAGQEWTLPAAPLASQLPGGCLTAASSAARAGVVVGPCAGVARAWTALPGGTVRSRGQCLEVSRGASAGKFPVGLAACTGAAAQRWTVTAVPGRPAGSGAWLRNRATGRCLADPAARGAGFAGRPAAVTGPCSAAAPGAAWQLR
jgi:GH25 family lysozyme M1 (1,4-beta-N-acetylmuramidase)